jgi:hypothetical protein
MREYRALGIYVAYCLWERDWEGYGLCIYEGRDMSYAFARRKIQETMRAITDIDIFRLTFVFLTDQLASPERIFLSPHHMCSCIDRQRVWWVL